MPLMTTHRSPIALKAMIFIDAGYFLHWLNELNIEKEKYDFGQFSKNIAGSNGFAQLDTVHLVRTYYYDALIDARKTEQFNRQRTFHDYLNYVFPNYEVRTGLLINEEKSTQKGVDSMISFDMISKAHGNQFDVAILVSGDLDHLPVVKMVKDLGKEVYGAYYTKSISQDLAKEFDARCELHQDNSKFELAKDLFGNFTKKS